MRQPIVVSFLLLIFSLPVLQVNAQQTSGYLSLEKAQKFQLQNDVKSVTSIEMMGQSMEMTADANMVHDLEVKSKNDSSFFVNSTLTKMKSNASVMGQTMSFDSEKKEDLESANGKAFKHLLNVTKEVHLDKYAKLLNTKNDAEDSAGDNADMMGLMKNMLDGMSDLSNGTNDAFMVLPAGKKKGDSWSDSLIADGLKIYRNFTLIDITGTEARINITGNQVTNKKIEQQGMELNVNVDSKLSGESVVDINTGIVKNKTLVLDGTGTTEMMGQSIPMITKVTSVITLKGR